MIEEGMIQEFDKWLQRVCKEKKESMKRANNPQIRCYRQGKAEMADKILRKFRKIFALGGE